MKRTLIALALVLGATAAVAEPSLNTDQNQVASMYAPNAPEATSFQASGQLVDDDAPGYPFNP